MSWIRPEARAALMRWREVIAGAALIWIGVSWAWGGVGFAPYLGTLIAALGAMFLYLGWRKVQLPAGGEGPGVVEVTERQISYLSAQGGGIIAVDGLVRVEVETSRSGTLRWHFLEDTGLRVAIPGDAKGAEALLDALVSLPGLNYDQAAAAVQADGADRFLIWQKDRRALH